MADNDALVGPIEGAETQDFGGAQVDVAEAGDAR